MKKTLLTIIAAATALQLASCGSGSVNNSAGNSELKGDIRLSGAFALYPLAVEWADEFQKLNPGVRVDVSAGGAGKGMTDAMTGAVDLGMVSREIYPKETEKGAIAFPTAQDAVVITINANNPKINELLTQGLTKDMARKIWIDNSVKTVGDILGNDDATPVHIYRRSDACGAAESFANWLGGKQEDIGGTAVFGDPGVASAIQKDIYGIGFNNIGYAYDIHSHKLNDGLRIFPIDTDNSGDISSDEQFYDCKDNVTKAIAEGKYPSPPARDLYLVSKGIPSNPIVVAFLKYVLTDGQKKNEPLGYISISKEKAEKALSQLDN